MINIEIAYVNEQEQYLKELEIPEGFTIEQVIKLSGILEIFPEINLNKTHKIGIFGKLCDKDTVLKQGNRIEIYRPLRIDTMVRRFKKVKEAKKNHVKK